VTATVQWLATHHASGGTFRIGIDGEDRVAEWLGVGTLRARRGGADARLVFEPHCPAQVKEKITRGSAMLLLRHLRGEMALHGAAVAKNGQALLLLGRSGSGKSTLAHTLVTEHGWELVADDAIALSGAHGSYQVNPTETNVWLSSSPGLEKAPRSLHRVAEAPVAVKAAIAFDFAASGTVTLTPLPPLQGMGTWVHGFVRFDLQDRELLALEARRIAELSTELPVHLLKRPRDLGRISEAEALLSELTHT
jgi:hypothetical protein